VNINKYITVQITLKLRINDDCQVLTNIHIVELARCTGNKAATQWFHSINKGVTRMKKFVFAVKLALMTLMMSVSGYAVADCEKTNSCQNADPIVVVCQGICGDVGTGGGGGNIDGLGGGCAPNCNATGGGSGGGSTANEEERIRRCVISGVAFQDNGCQNRGDKPIPTSTSQLEGLGAFSYSAAWNSQALIYSRSLHTATDPNYLYGVNGYSTQVSAYLQACGGVKDCTNEVAYFFGIIRGSVPELPIIGDLVSC
jgi:hypothetical protein